MGVNGINVGVQEIQSIRKGVNFLMNDVWYNVVIGFGCASSRTLWGNFRFLRFKLCVVVVVVYGPPERDAEKMEGFWNDLDRVIDRVGNGYRLGALGYLNE